MERGRVISRVVGELGSSINGEGSAQQVLDSSGYDGRFAKIRNLAVRITSTRQVMIVSELLDRKCSRLCNNPLDAVD